MPPAGAAHNRNPRPRVKLANRRSWVFSPGVNPADGVNFREVLDEIGRARMPFGKFGPQAFPPQGVPIEDLPVEYLAWFKLRGFPKGRLGQLLEMVYEVKACGMDQVFNPHRRARGGRTPLQPRVPPGLPGRSPG
ncbi:MAG TPA: DUF3820 family protein [Verrucomicrobiales bacterium]|nr:DUF3820 family protein [Verrucomicrobiales bacterium]